MVVVSQKLGWLMEKIQKSFEMEDDWVYFMEKSQNRSKWMMTGAYPYIRKPPSTPPKKIANGSQMSEIPSNHGSTLGAVDSHVDHSRWQGMET